MIEELERYRDAIITLSNNLSQVLSRDCDLAIEFNDLLVEQLEDEIEALHRAERVAERYASVDFNQLLSWMRK